MISTLYTIGFTKKTASEFFRLLEEAGVQKVVDIRENRTGQLQGFARFPDIAFFLDRILHISYESQPLFAPSPEIRTVYRKTRDWKQYERAFGELMNQREVLDQIRPEEYEGKVALLCSEAEPEKCHRRLVAEMLALHWNAGGHHIEIRHLVIHKPRRAKKHKRGSDAGSVPV